jgi:hypothetical protein
MSDATSARELVLFLPAVFKLCHSLISTILTVSSNLADLDTLLFPKLDP